MEKALSSYQVCDIIKSLYQKAENIKTELELTASDTILSRREQGFADYKKFLNEYLERYNAEKVGLLEYIDKETLLDFIVEEAVSTPGLFIDLALKIGVANQWSNFPTRGI